MPIYFTPEGRLVAWYQKNTIEKYRPIISRKLIDKYGKGPFDEAQINKILFYTLDWYQQKFIKILQNENELTFYQGLFLLHEFSCAFQQENPNVSPIKELDNKEFAVYRRILKLCLEQACDLKLVSSRPSSIEYLKEKEDVIDQLLYFGDFIFACSNLLAEQQLIEDCIDLKFTSDNQFYFDHKHYYGFLITKLMDSFKSHIDMAVTGKNDLNDFIAASKKCLGVEYGAAVGTIKAIHENSESGKFTLDEWFIYPKNLENLYGVSYEQGSTFFKGLTLSKENKMSLQDAVYKPHNLNKYLYRPFLIWNVNGKNLTFVGDRSFVESIMSLTTNAFGWNKYPIEWENPCFKEFIKNKVMYNDKILEDEAEKLLKTYDIIFDRNITYLKKWNGQHINIDNEECGEIDFLFIHNKKIIIADSKHQIARYDMNNFKNDRAYFETNKKSYNKTIKRKLTYLTSKIHEVQEHFQVLTNNKDLRIETFSFEGIFIINTPTFIMYNNEYRIHTLKAFKEILENKFIDQVYKLVIDEGDNQKILDINYPYFKKTSYKVMDFE
ncbi:hypothetical protein [Flavobacterium microcysteis]|uniref:NERD domain-containing protein n=1 Tax=Flavobacterium microcysteis TaxID=2596891 RepID=A0A501QB46_9FLAO|nr:hypothetical protein [Flavobacterium microcysteis]TPD69913.1 hypothetical protein FJA49_08380 [Flavobacterium microcysteis]